MNCVNYKELYFLRKCTNLNPYQFLKLKKLRLEEQKKLNTTGKANFEKIDYIEYVFRLKSYQINRFEVWQKYGQKHGLDEFMSRLLESEIISKR